MSLRQDARRLLGAIILLAACATPALAQQGRGPATPEEKARVAQIAIDAEKDPLTVLAATGEWFEKWVEDVPDITLKPGPAARWCVEAAKGDMRKVVQFQYGASALAYQIAHKIDEPKKPEEVSAVDQAAIEGVLRAYEILAAKAEKNRSPKFDEAVARRNKGELAAFIAALPAPQR